MGGRLQCAHVSDNKMMIVGVTPRILATLTLICYDPLTLRGRLVPDWSRVIM